MIFRRSLSLFRLRRGFTFIEMICVFLAIGVMAAIAVPNFLEAQIRSKVGRTRTDQAAMVAALNGYFADHLMYPTNIGGRDLGPKREELSAMEKTLGAYFTDDPALRIPAGGQEFFARCATFVPPPPAPPPQAPANPFRAWQGGRTGFPDWFKIPGVDPYWTKAGYSLTCLTTPVAYVGRELPVDTFADIRGTPFSYVNTGVVRDLVPEPARDATPTRFLLLSFGPNCDQAFGGNLMNPVSGPFVPYDPTNGTVSEGDVFCTGAE